jgi:polyisoprenoid-binding protein YceI
MMNVRRTIVGIGAAASIGLVLFGAATWYLLLRSDAPPPVSVAAAIESATTPDASGADGVATQSDADLVGEWSLVQGTSSFVGYRVQEELAGIGSTTAVGRTQGVSGALTFNGSEIAAVEISADLTTLASDKSMRDNALRTQALETGAYPTATFELTQPISVSEVPADGETVTQTIVGNLTLHGVTRAVEIEVQALIQGNRLLVVGSTEIAFADFNISQPRAASVLSVEDHGAMELQLVFERAA